MNSESKSIAQKKVNEVINNIKTMADAIDSYQKDCPEDKDFIYDTISDGVNRSVTTEFNGKEITIDLF
jgi:hypothetical protein